MEIALATTIQLCYIMAFGVENFYHVIKLLNNRLINCLSAYTDALKQCSWCVRWEKKEVMQ